MMPTAQQYQRRLVKELRGKGAIRTDRVRDAFLAVPRHPFIQETARERGLGAAYTDEAVPTRTDALGMALSSCSQPGIVAMMLELLDVHAGQRVLEIGAGTGYNAALLSALVEGRGRVISVDVDRETASRARRTLRAVGAQARVTTSR